MKKILLGKSIIKTSAVAVGCMRIDNMNNYQLKEFVDNAISKEVNIFDHADIYGGGECERKFGIILSEDKTLREKIVIQSKCGIVPGIMYDFSKEYILKSVDGILDRLNTEYIDVLLLHRPDALVEPEEVAEAFEILQKTGKVKYFGVSNHKPMQIELLKKYINQDIIANQLQFSITNSNMICNGMEVNMLTEGSIDRDGSVLDYCRINDITIQAWSPFQYGFFEGVYIDNPKFSELNKIINMIADKYCVTATSIVAAWILRHPSNMQIISGTTDIKRFNEICDGSDIKLSREEWYKIYLAAGHMLP